MCGRDAPHSFDIRVFLGLWLVSLLIYAPFVGQWSLSGDEYYTYEDSTFSIAKMLSFNLRPLYFIVCHYLLVWLPDWPVELTIRVPALLTTSLVAPSIYGMLSPCRFRAAGLFAAFIAIWNPWLFQMSQFGRYYGFVLFFATITTVAALRFVQERDRIKWPILVVVSGIAAAVSHPPAALIVPAAILGWIAAGWWDQPEATMRWLKKYSVWFAIVFSAALVFGAYLLQDVLRQWASAGQGDFGGGYDTKSIAVSLAVIGGLSSWSIALFPLIRSTKTWSAEDVFLMVLLTASTLPLLALVPIGGGVSSRYLLYCLPCMYVLAGQHWGHWHSLLPTWGAKLALAGVIFGCNVPLMLSVMSDGNHYDFRTMARTIENLGIENPIIFSSDHGLLDYYLDDRFPVKSENADEVGLFAEGLPKTLLQRAIAQANEQARDLLVVSRQDRRLLSTDEQAWLYDRFAVLRTVEYARYDHRRHRLVLYHYRPMIHSPGSGS